MSLFSIHIHTRTHTHTPVAHIVNALTVRSRSALDVQYEPTGEQPSQHALDTARRRDSTPARA